MPWSGTESAARDTEVSGGHAEPRFSETADVRVKGKILDSEYASGSQVLEQDIAATLGLSRTPVREALVLLQQEGLLEIVPRHGIRISVMSPSDMQEIYEISLSLEPTAVELLARRGPTSDELSELTEAYEAMKGALAASAPRLADWAEADERYHLGLVNLCGDRRLAAMVRRCGNKRTARGCSRWASVKSLIDRPRSTGPWSTPSLRAMRRWPARSTRLIDAADGRN